MYVAHNYGFLAYSASMQGRAAESIESANAMRHTMPVELLVAMPGTDWYVSEVYAALMRFGRWDELLAEPVPDSRLPVLTGGTTSRAPSRSPRRVVWMRPVPRSPSSRPSPPPRRPTRVPV